jgi:putative transcriptional regulator
MPCTGMPVIEADIFSGRFGAPGGVIARPRPGFAKDRVGGVATRVKIDLNRASSLPKGRVNKRRLDATTEKDLALQKKVDDAGALLDAAKFARRVRKRLGLTQLEFSNRIDVSLDTIRNWEQGKRCPTGAAKALLKILNKSPESALLALS